MIDAEEFDREKDISLQEQLSYFDAGDYFEAAGHVYRVDGQHAYVEVNPTTFDQIDGTVYSKDELLERIPEGETVSPYGPDTSGILSSYGWMHIDEENDDTEPCPPRAAETPEIVHARYDVYIQTAYVCTNGIPQPSKN